VYFLVGGLQTTQNTRVLSHSQPPRFIASVGSPSPLTVCSILALETRMKEMAVAGVGSSLTAVPPSILCRNGVTVAILPNGATCTGGGDAWKPPWAGRGGFKPAPVVSVVPIHGPTMDAWRHLEKEIPTPRDSSFQHSKASPVPLSSPNFSVVSTGSSVRSASRPTFSPNLVWVAEECGKGSSSKCWKGSVSGDSRSFVQVLQSRPATICMVPPRQNRGWGRQGFGSRRGGQGGRGLVVLAIMAMLGTTKGEVMMRWHKWGSRSRGIKVQGV
jgi:hypothetical protein